ncbi:MAG: hypothetical protein NZM25_00580 [Leptospiraceae bacterium]|nr:hypothetical protein [Leptospiraceae bacterium]MDW8306220.1 hypothetical protein [Leptospiraceae bacterium]
MRICKWFIGLAVLLNATVALLAATPSEFQNEFKKMNEAISKYFSEKQPFINSLGLHDATGAKYGFPFFAVGVTGGLAILPNPAEDLNVNKNIVNTDKLPIKYDVLPLPYNPTIFGRVGIPGVDLDIGVKVGLPVNLGVEKFSYKSTSFGGELRYSILTQGITPGLSIAAGFDYLDSTLSYSYSGNFGAYNVDFKTENHSHLINYHLTGRVGYDILFLSLLAGLQLYLPTGEVETKTTGTFHNGAYSLNSLVKSEAEGIRAKLIGGLYFRLPLSRIGFQFDYEPQSEAMGLSLSAQLVF